MSKSVLRMFCSTSFIVSGLTFRSLIHFEFISVYGVKCSNFFFFFFFFTCSCPVFPAPLMEETGFSHCILLPPLSKIKVTIGA